MLRKTKKTELGKKKSGPKYCYISEFYRFLCYLLSRNCELSMGVPPLLDILFILSCHFKSKRMQNNNHHEIVKTFFILTVLSILSSFNDDMIFLSDFNCYTKSNLVMVHKFFVAIKNKTEWRPFKIIFWSRCICEQSNDKEFSCGCFLNPVKITTHIHQFLFFKFPHIFCML